MYQRVPKGLTRTFLFRSSNGASWTLSSNNILVQFHHIFRLKFFKSFFVSQHLLLLKNLTRGAMQSANIMIWINQLHFSKEVVGKTDHVFYTMCNIHWQRLCTLCQLVGEIKLLNSSFPSFIEFVRKPSSFIYKFLPASLNLIEITRSFLYKFSRLHWIWLNRLDPSIKVFPASLNLFEKAGSNTSFPGFFEFDSID